MVSDENKSIWLWLGPITTAISIFALADDLIQIPAKVAVWISAWRQVSHFLWGGIIQLVSQLFNIDFPGWLAEYITLCVIVTCMEFRGEWSDMRRSRWGRYPYRNKMRLREHRMGDWIYLYVMFIVDLILSPVRTPFVLFHSAAMSVVSFVVVPRINNKHGFVSDQQKQDDYDLYVSERKDRGEDYEIFMPTIEELMKRADDVIAMTWWEGQKKNMRAVLENSHRFENRLRVFWRTGFIFIILIAINYSLLIFWN